MVNDAQSRLERVKKYVAHNFPDMAEVSPQVSKAGPGSTASYIFTFRGKVAHLAGGNMQQILRVTTDAQGEILKVAASR
ncbi:MAG: hypothetical protein HYX86_03185 [Chloroflexi bacterium]|nr:hypothetical protein [Chloroflexota bacterium]